MSKHPQLLWAQRENTLLLTVEVGGLVVEDLSFKGKTFHVKGTDAAGSQTYETTLDLFDECNNDTLRKIATDRQLELVVEKTKPEWWPRLTSAKGKCAWVKVDFNKWKDEDEVDEDEADPAGGMGGMGGMGDMDLSKLMSGMGGMGGMGGLGGDDLPGLPDDELDLSDDEEEEQMPPLEPVEEKP